ncbi:S9 family peptidase [Hufsiella ginkgonis]|uniref:S9 family peptidase n=1 Tax=Hufsiella ginkgonis TaxID=2695274 RepID=UPI001927A1BE|nr:prolyl oligopeptidase family serine peptidase [Hufsiella ginkgonis]
MPFLTLALYAQQKPAITWKDVSRWRSIKSFSDQLSPDGKWMAWVTGPTEGDLEVVLRSTSDTLTRKYPCGAVIASVSFSGDSRYFAFKVAPKDAEAKAAKKINKPLFDKLAIISIADNKKTEFEKVKTFAFPKEASNWVAIHFAGSAPAGPPAPDAAKGTDLLLYNVVSKKSFNIGNVSEYSFNKNGNLLAYTIDAAGQNGNGILLYDFKTGIASAIDNDKATYKSIRWTDNGDAFALLKSNKNEKYKSDVFSVIGVSKLNGDLSEKTIYSGIEDETFPKGMGISTNSRPYWSDDLGTLFFGIDKLEASDKKPEGKADSANRSATKRPDSAGVKAQGPSMAAAAKKDDIEKPDMIIWNWQDKRLQSAQQVQEITDKNYSYLGMYRPLTKKYTRLADSTLRSVVIAPKQLYAIGYDNSSYELMSNLDGQSYTDIYLIDLKTGKKSILFSKFYQTGAGGISMAPNGKAGSYYKDGTFYSINFATGESKPLTSKINASFVNELDDHNVLKPATRSFGWTADSKYVLIKDNYDLWKVSADGSAFTALTNNWKAKKQEVQGRFSVYENEKGADLTRTQYFSVFDRATKKQGIGILEPGKNSINVLFMGDNSYDNLTRATKGNTFVFSKSNSLKSPEFYVAGPALASATQISQNTPDQEKYGWSSGVKLINYVSANGDSLQAALYLPANYEPGKAYPTITYIYERLTDGLNAYTMPAFPGGGFNKAVYNSNGYAVLMPDITYKLNDPGMSAVACVVPAVKAAIATGIVDGKNVAIHGHSWGGYQTSFLITQTNIFKAAAAGAPLTNMISMYSLIYWNSGGTNQAIFEASQGRLTPGYWDNWDAFARNSPIYHIKKVNTPLLLLHNDKDGAVDFTQGVEYYNGLRRLNKPVVMITYKGENHGIVKLPNRKDYAVRMLEYFDYQLKGKPAPDWWSKGVNKLDMEKYIEARAFEEAGQ